MCEREGGGGGGGGVKLALFHYICVEGDRDRLISEAVFMTSCKSDMCAHTLYK